jgi:hypothetical protein
MAEPEITSEGLKFIRDEILKLMVASIATAKAEALAEVDARIVAAKDLMGRAIAMSGAGSNMGAAEIGCALALALGERGAIDPSRAVAWAEWMADNQPEATESSVAESAATTLRSFAKVLSAMMKRRPDGPSGRN